MGERKPKMNYGEEEGGAEDKCLRAFWLHLGGQVHHYILSSDVLQAFPAKNILKHNS